MNRPNRRYLLCLALCAIVWLPLHVFTHLLDAWDVAVAEDYLKGSSRVVYFGDSVLDATDACEQEKTPIFEHVGNLLGEKVLALRAGGLSAIVYRKMAKFLARFPRTRVVVIPINMRSFSAEWFPRPFRQYPERQAVFDILSGSIDVGELYHVLYSHDDAATEAAVRETFIYDDVISLGTIASVEQQLRTIKPIGCNQDYEGQDEVIGLRYRYNYGNLIEPDHPMLHFMQETADILRRSSIEPLFYITPINMDEIKRIGGRALTQRVASNIDVIGKVADRNAWQFIDLSGAVRHEDFIDLMYAGEHVNWKGRRIIAAQVAQKVRAVLTGSDGASTSPN
jgi:hypothetical protein